MNEEKMNEEKMNEEKMSEEKMNEEKMSSKKSIPLLGDKLPSIKVQTTHGIKSIPEDYSKKWFVLFSHPADFTPVCTTEFVAFQNRYEEFKKLNTELVGLSIDQVFSHIKWVDWIKENLNVQIEFPIIADNTDVAKTFGMVHEGKGSNTVRAVFIIDTKGYVRLIMYYPQEIGRNIDEILRSIRALQISDKEGVAMPENWPNNELFKDEVIIPPAKDIKTARERLKSKEYTCLDWWLCHKKRN